MQKIHFIKFIIKILVLAIYIYIYISNMYIMYNDLFWFWQNILLTIKINNYIFKKSNLLWIILNIYTEKQKK